MSNHSSFLDVEDDDQRQNRIGTLLERLNTTSSSSPVSRNSLFNAGHERTPGPVEPPYELLARVEAFLPAISASNDALSRQNPEDVDIENVPEDEGQYIEMNLGLGVFEAKPRPSPGSRQTSPSSETDSEPDPTSYGTSSESTSDSESSHSSAAEDDSDYSSAPADDDSDAESEPGSLVHMQPISSRPLKPLPRAKLEV